MPVDPKTLPRDPDTLQKMLVDVTAQPDRTERLLRQLLAAKTGRKSEQLSREQLALFAREAGIALPESEQNYDDHDEEPPASTPSSSAGASRGRKPLPRHLKRERIEHAGDRSTTATGRTAVWIIEHRMNLRRLPRRRPSGPVDRTAVLANKGSLTPRRAGRALARCAPLCTEVVTTGGSGGMARVDQLE